MNRFEQSLVDNHNYTPAEAHAIYALYRKEKIVKIDGINGSILITHGAFMDKDVLDRALQATRLEE